MRHGKKLTLFACMLSFHIALCQDPLTAPLVYQESAMKNVKVEQANIFKQVSSDTALHFDIYFPADYKTTQEYPAVIFVNGIGSNEPPKWRVYQDWAKLVAAHGMIGITHESRQGKAYEDTNELLNYLQKHSTRLRIDPGRLALWGCSANVGVALPLAMKKENKSVRALVMYYGAGWSPEDNVVTRQDVEIMLVRAGLDFYNLNKNIAAFMQDALNTDARIEYVNYPDGQHAFDVLDDNERSRAIIRQTVDFLQRKLAKDYPKNDDFVLTNTSLWHMILEEKKTEEALMLLEKAFAKYSTMPNHTWRYNHIIDERNLNQLGYDLLQKDRAVDALKVFQANQKAFPTSANVYDAVSDAFEKTGDNANAVKYAKIALEKLETNPNIHPQTKQAIKESAEGKIKRLNIK